MACGVVPVQVDEIAIWPPTAEQLSESKAIAYANVHRRGLRTSESTVQLTSAQNGEMLMEIVNMRATAYEAAVPQRLESALEEAPYGQMAWELDFEDPKNREGLATSELANLALFKYPASKVAELGMGHATEILRANPETLYTVIVTSEEELEAATRVVAGYRNARAVHVDPSQELEPQGLKKESYDILIAGPQGQSLLNDIVKPGASVMSSELTVAGKTSEAKPDNTASVQLVYRNYPTNIVATVMASLEALGWDVKVSSLMASTSNVEGHVIMLADFESPLLFTLQEEEFAAIQNIVAHTSSLLWVTPGGFLQGKQPEYAMVSGLARAITAEQASLDFRVLDVDPASFDAESVVQSVVRVLKMQTKPQESPEREFCVSGDKTYISRLVRNKNLNELYTAQDKPDPKSFTPGDRVSGLVSKSKVVFQQQQQEEKSGVEPGHVEVQVQSSGLTKEGVLVITGSDYATTLSQEIGGVVTRVGQGVSGFTAGDRVVGFHAAHFDSYQQVPAMMLQRLKTDEDMTNTVSGLSAYAAALYGLQTLAGVRKGENVLVLNKTGSAGVAAIKLAQRKGANVYVVVDAEEEVAFLQTHLGLDTRHIIRASDGLVSERLEQLTCGHGADVVFSDGSSVDPTAAHEAWRCIASFGRFLDSGRKGTSGAKALNSLPVHRSASYIPFDILELYQSRPEVLSELLPAIVSEVNRTDSSSIPIKPIHLGEIDRAVSEFSDAFGAGKPVIQYQTSDIPIQILPTRGGKLRLRSDVTYLLVGCLGGLGRSLTLWMMECGARRFTFLSRSGADAESAAELVRQLQAAGAVVQVVRGDATSAEDVSRAVRGVPSEHPIRGVIHAAMVLRVSSCLSYW
jgi:NADPH:quinone reductase-like Zn-dependent oxidoreductase